MKQLKGGARDYKTRIIKFLTETDPITLDADEEKVLGRWEMADRLLRAREPHSYIVSELVSKYGITPTTAHSDIYAAMDVFGRSRKLNKQYLLHHHLDDLDMAIQKILKLWFNPDDPTEVYHPDAKELAALARLMQVKTEIINSLPADSNKRSMPPPVFMFKLANGGVVSNDQMSLEDALTYADDIISGKITNELNDGDGTGIDK